MNSIDNKINGEKR